MHGRVLALRLSARSVPESRQGIGPHLNDVLTSRAVNDLLQLVLGRVLLVYHKGAVCRTRIDEHGVECIPGREFTDGQVQNLAAAGRGQPQGFAKVDA